MLLKVFGITWVDTWHGANSFIYTAIFFHENCLGAIYSVYAFDDVF